MHLVNGVVALWLHSSFQPLDVAPTMPAHGDSVTWHNTLHC